MTEEKYFFEKEIYSRGRKFKFEPDKEIIRSILNIKYSGRVLDIGCGEAGTSLKLAELGFDVTVIDISKTAINMIKKEAKKRRLKINCMCVDIENYNLERNYDIIIVIGVLHLVSKRFVKDVINTIKAKTNLIGINIIDVFLKGSKCEIGSKGYYFNKEEIIGFYPEWKLIEHEFYNEEINKNEFAIFQK